MPLILVRHTRPEGGDGICYGRTDLAAAPGFEPEARRLAARIARDLGPADRIVSSPLRRCTALAEALARHLALPLALDPRWAELDFGAWEGRPWDEIPRAELDAWAGDLLHARPHGGESVAMLAARVAAAIAACPAGERTLVVTHAGPIRAALAAWDRPIGYGEAVTP
ncbi:MAG TPA: histidine phosphatase family protein [Amaricoccus sp.]|nr:histidine phosphatase family protein [Amaricoccus sp.]